MSDPEADGKAGGIAPEAQLSTAEIFACAPDFTEQLAGYDTETLRRFAAHWSFWARPGQLVPVQRHDWRTWLLMAGRGYGKTRAGAEWVRALGERRRGLHIALVGGTIAEARNVMVEGESGLLAIASPDKRPEWEPSLGRLTWPSGTRAQLYSAAEPDSLRGAGHHYAWADEIAKWPKGQAAWDNLELTVRNGLLPRIVATTTPRPVPLIRWLTSQPRVMLGGGRTRDNRGHLAPDFIAAMEKNYGGKRLGRQELNGELIDEIEGALWSRKVMERQRVLRAPERIRRVVIGVDPPAGAGADSDACGIVVVAMGEEPRHAYVIADASVRGLSPEGWARAVATAAESHGADRIIAEANNGGAMVASVLRAAGAEHLSVRLAHAARGKAARAEPVAALYERGVAWHAGAFPELEDELAGMVTGGDYCGPGRSPDRADALVWAMTELMLGRKGREPRIRGL